MSDHRKIDDTLRSMPKKNHYACCPKDGEPLICTLEFAGMEFICVICGGLYGFMAPIGKEATPELEARHKELQARYDA